MTCTHPDNARMIAAPFRHDGHRAGTPFPFVGLVHVCMGCHRYIYAPDGVRLEDAPSRTRHAENDVRHVFREWFRTTPGADFLARHNRP